jgi:hypothetical protein
MVLLHYLVVPGLGDGIVPRPEATADRAGEAFPPDRGDVTTLTAPTDTEPPVADSRPAA